MSLQYGLLGLLTYRNSTGYELSKVFNDSLNNFWHAQASQIYRELDRMEKKGWVSFSNVLQEKRPNKRVYEITDAGRAALREWLGSGEVKFENAHEPLLVRIFFGAEAPEVTLAMLKECRDYCLKSIDDFSAGIQAKINQYAAELPDGRSMQMYWEMTLDYGISQTRMTADWAQRCIDKISNSNNKQ